MAVPPLGCTGAVLSLVNNFYYIVLYLNSEELKLSPTLGGLDTQEEKQSSTL